MLTKFFNGSFGKSMIVSIIVLVAVNIFLCAKSKFLQADIQAKTTEIALTQADNRHLVNQLKIAQVQIEQYQKQMKALQDNVLAKLQQAEERTNEIITELDNHKSWANQSIPTAVSRLLNQRTAKPKHQAKSADLPQGKPLPTAQPQPQK